MPLLSTAATYDSRTKVTSFWHRFAARDNFANSLKKLKQLPSSSSIAAYPLEPLYAVFNEYNMILSIDHKELIGHLSCFEHEIGQHGYGTEGAIVAKDLFAMNFPDLIRGLNSCGNSILTMQMGCEYLIESIKHVSKRLQDDSASIEVYGSTYIQQYKSQISYLNFSQKSLLTRLQGPSVEPKCSWL